LGGKKYFLESSPRSQAFAMHVQFWRFSFFVVVVFEILDDG
jgi:hypothetical protein